MKVIFLDIDGVLATDQQFGTVRKNFQAKHHWARKLNVPYPYCQRAVAVLNEILMETGAEIVLSSDWKKFWNLEKLDIIFRANGILKSPIDITGYMRAGFMDEFDRDRAFQIMTYIYDKNVTNYVIIDDLYLEEFVEDKDRFFRTNSWEGIKMTGLKVKIINKLNQTV